MIPNDVEQAYNLLQQLVDADENRSAIEYVAWMPRQYCSRSAANYINSNSKVRLYIHLYSP